MAYGVVVAPASQNPPSPADAAAAETMMEMKFTNDGGNGDDGAQQHTVLERPHTVLEHQ